MPQARQVFFKKCLTLTGCLRINKGRFCKVLQRSRGDIASKSSFRDPSGFIFYEDGQIFRKINPVYFEIYRTLKEEKIFETLQQEGLLIEHREERERIPTGS